MKRGTGAWQETHYGPGCKGPTQTIAFCGTRITVHRATVGAFLALAAVIARHGYQVRKADTAAKVCRKITGGDRLSNHAYGTAVDINWATNPYGPRLVTDMPAAMVADIEALRTRSGVQLFRWGGRYSVNKDAMHFEVMATPAEIAAGIHDPKAAQPKPPAPRPTPPQEDDMPITDAEMDRIADKVAEKIAGGTLLDGSPITLKSIVEPVVATAQEVLGHDKTPGLRGHSERMRDSIARLVKSRTAPPVDTP